MSLFLNILLNLSLKLTLIVAIKVIGIAVLPSLAAASSVDNLVYQITDSSGEDSVAAFLQYQVEDDSHFYTDEIINNEAFNEAFKPVPNRDANFGYVTKTHWFKLSIRGPTENKGKTQRWYLELDYPFMDDIQIFSPQSDGTYLIQTVGDLYPFHARAIDLPSYLFHLDIVAQKTHHIFFRIKTSTSIQMPLVLWSENRFIERNAESQYWLGAFYGVMFGMLLYNLFVYFSVRDKAYVYYILYIACIIMTNMVINGYAFQKVWPHSPWLANVSFPVMSFITCFFSLQFTRVFLQIGTYKPALDKALRVFAIFTLLMTLSPYVIGQFNATVLAVFIPIPAALTIFFTGIYGMIKQHRRAMFFVLAWGALIICFIARALLQFEVLPNVFVTQYGTQLGSLAEVILLSLALADRINIEKAERQSAVNDSLVSLTKKQEAEKALMHQSYHDRLTGAPNRSLFVQSLQEQLESFDPEKNKLLVCTIHFSGFHDVNFTLGHHAGDKVLIMVTQEMNREISAYPGIRQISLDTKDNNGYVGLMEGVNLSFILQLDPEMTEHKALEPLVQKLAQPFVFEDMLLDLGGKIGVSVWPQDDETSDGLTRKSMIAVRAAKWSKLPMMCYDQNIDKYSELKLALTGELIRAIDQNELVLHYQPKVDLETGKVVSMEALVRWQHPTRGLLFPGDFVDIAESTGIIQPLTQWVMNSAVEFCSGLRRNGYNISVAINLSVRNLLSDQLVPKAIEITDRWLFPKNQLIMEVVESAVIDDMEQARKTLDGLSENGIRLSLDDFGTGYSSLTYLKKLPIQELKLDRSFVTNLINDRDDEVIVETTIAIAKQLNLKVVAEGIEDEATQKKLKEIGCDLGQGYHIQRPIPGDEFKQWLASQSVLEHRL